MTSSMHFFVESEGITLPNGIVFGGGCEYKYLISHGECGMDAFKIYQVVDGKYIRISEPIRYKEMKAWVDEQIAHYNSCGMKLWLADHSDPKMQTYKKRLVDTKDF